MLKELEIRLKANSTFPFQCIAANVIFCQKSNSSEGFFHLYFFLTLILFVHRKKKICEGYAKAMGMEEALHVRNKCLFFTSVVEQCCSFVLEDEAKIPGT